MLAELGIDREIRALLLSHGRTSRVQAKHYDRYSYFAEKRTALEKGEMKLRAIVDGRPSKGWVTAADFDQ
jgi:hypothetical protein